VVAFGLCVISFIAVHYFVEETLPKDKLISFGAEANDLIRKVSSINLFQHFPYAKNSQRNEKFPKFVASSPSTSSFLLDTMDENPDRESNNEDQVTVSWLWNRDATRRHLLAYWFYSFLVVSVDESFPLFCMSVSSGLGITESQIGNILTGSGLCYVLMQYFAVTKMVSKFGAYNAMLIASVTSIPMASLLPFSLLLNRGSEPGELRIGVLVYLSIVYSILRVSSSVVFSTLTMTTNRTVPFHARATMNGFSMLGGSLGKALGPTFAGTLFAFSVSSGVFKPPFGSVNVFCIIALLGLVLIAMAQNLKKFMAKLNSANQKCKMDDDVCSSMNGERDEEMPTF